MQITHRTIDLTIALVLMMLYLTVVAIPGFQQADRAQAVPTIAAESID